MNACENGGSGFSRMIGRDHTMKITRPSGTLLNACPAFIEPNMSCRKPSISEVNFLPSNVPIWYLGAASTSTHFLFLSSPSTASSKKSGHS